MGEDFVRCYIGNIRFFTLKDVLRASGKLDEWELLEGAKFNHKQSYGYKQVIERDELLLEALAKRSVVAETKQPKVVRPSLLWNNALDIADALTLLSLARAKYHPILAVERNSGHRYSIGWGLMARQESGNWDVVSIDNLGQFVSGALFFIEHNPAWLKETGFIPSLYWYTQAQLSHPTPDLPPRK
jgi:hypothetical protein